MTLGPGTLTAQLRQCTSCGWWTRWLDQRGRCGDCGRGWYQCLEHGRLEYGDHQRVAVRDVLTYVAEVRG